MPSGDFNSDKVEVENVFLTSLFLFRKGVSRNLLGTHFRHFDRKYPKLSSQENLVNCKTRNQDLLKIIVIYCLSSNHTLWRYHMNFLSFTQLNFFIFSLSFLCKCKQKLMWMITCKMLKMNY